MILANETVAGYLERRGFPCLYRVHEPPASDAWARSFPCSRSRLVRKAHGGAAGGGGSEGHPGDFGGKRAPQRGGACQLASAAGHEKGRLPAENQGHYGLASEVYCHFTSPIRRYPDLVVHRMLRAALTRRPEKFDQEMAALPWIGEHSSAMERVAEAAARES